MRLVGYCSKILSTSEKHYTAADTESLAVVWRNLRIQTHPWRDIFRLRMSRQAMKRTFKLGDSRRRLANLQVWLAKNGHEIEYRHEVKQSAADELLCIRKGKKEKEILKN